MDYKLLMSCYVFSSTILLLSNAIHSFEFLIVRKSYNGLIYFKQNKTSKLSIADLNNHISKNRFHLIVVILSSITLLALLSNPLSIFYRVLFLALTFLHFYSYTKRKIGRDGADQIRLLAFLSFTLSFLAKESFILMMPLCFLGIQLLIAYSTSGLAKLFSVHWRKGNVLADILMTNSYGNKRFAHYLKSNPKVEKLLSHGAIFSMLFVPFSFFIPVPELFFISLTGMFFFHISTAILMGLNDFLITIPLTYPAVYYLYLLTHNFSDYGFSII